MPDLAPEAVHDHLLDRAPRILRFDPEDYFPEWQSAVRRSFKQLLGLMPAKVSTDPQILSDETLAAPVPHRRIRFLFTAEPRAHVPCTLLLPQNKSAPHPLVICLQGHGAQASRNLGGVQDYDFAIQALQNGYAALSLELRCFGERAEQRPLEAKRGNLDPCHHPALAALLVGRTMIGERVFDISRALDTLLEHFPQIDPNKIAVMGFSGGGRIAYYAAAFDPRIAAVMPASCLCPFKESVGQLTNCPCQYLPNIMHYFDMSDLAGLIVPRPLIILTGKSDPIFPLAAVERCTGEIQQIYKAQNAENACRLIVTPVGHEPSPMLMWPALKEVTGWT